jgi:4-oxalomesaconate tautomerase
VHTSIGVLMAASVAAAARIPGTSAHALASAPREDVTVLEHPGGLFTARAEAVQDEAGTWRGASASERTARKLFDGRVFPRPRR